ncbi:MAG TPA: PAS domain-containing protein [Stellaceae bacterium]|nr:PAS domain-containing protein [Stellaceae bacterium]
MTQIVSDPVREYTYGVADRAAALSRFRLLGDMDSTSSFSLKRLFDAFRPAPAGPTTGPDDRAVGSAPFRVKSDESLAAEKLKRVWHILEPKRGQRPFLARVDIDPGELVFVLPFVALVEVHPQLRFRHRLVGTGYRDALGFEATNMWVEDWPNVHQRGLIVRSYVAAVEAREAVGFRGELLGDQQPVRYEALLLPLSNDGETINMLFLAGATVGEPAGT